MVSFSPLVKIFNQELQNHSREKTVKLTEPSNYLNKNIKNTYILKGNCEYKHLLHIKYESSSSEDVKQLKPIYYKI